MPRTIFNGEPGTIFTNTGKVFLYQFVASLENTCGMCIQYHMAIGTYWPIPLHGGCRCENSPLPPGSAALPFVDFREIIADLDPRQRAVVVGKSNLLLIESGVVRWEDVVTPSRVRDLREVVALKKLSVDRMTGVGIKPYLAESAHATVHTPAHELAARKQAQLLESLRSRGIDRKQTVKAVAEGVAARVSIGGGPSGPQPSPVSPTLPRPPLSPDVADRLGIRLYARVREVSPSETPDRTRERAAAKTAAFAVADRESDAARDAAFRARFEAYTEGDRKVAEIARIADRVSDLKADAERAFADLADALRRNNAARPGAYDWIKSDEDISAARNRASSAQSRHIEAAGRSRVDVSEILGTAGPGNLNPTLAASVKGELRSEVGSAVNFVAGIVRLDDPTEFHVRLVPRGQGDRAFYGGGDVNLTRESPSATVVHEIGHMLEEQVRGWNDAAQAFLKRRVGDEKPTRLNAIGGDFASYGDDETGRKDRFEDAFGIDAWYVGKDYHRYASEITAMGLELLYADPLRFARKDPEYLKFLLGVLDGGLR